MRGSPGAATPDGASSLSAHRETRSPTGRCNFEQPISTQVFAARGKFALSAVGTQPIHKCYSVAAGQEAQAWMNLLFLTGAPPGQSPTPGNDLNSGPAEQKKV